MIHSSQFDVANDQSFVLIAGMFENAFNADDNSSFTPSSNSDDDSNGVDDTAAVAHSEFNNASDDARALAVDADDDDDDDDVDDLDF